MLKILLLVYAIADLTLLIFLFKQYKMLLQSDEYLSDSLLNRFIVGSMAIGGMLCVLALLVATSYYIIYDSL